MHVHIQTGQDKDDDRTHLVVVPIEEDHTLYMLYFLISIRKYIQFKEEEAVVFNGKKGPANRS